MSRPFEVPDHVADPVGSHRLWTVPNALTGLRLLLVPVLAWLLFAGDPTDQSQRLWAMTVFIVAALTDFADGAIARSRNSVTTVGKIADPIADKAITGVALIGLSWAGDLPWWVTLLILGREVGVTIVRLSVIRHGVIPASRGGKAKTVAQIIAISLYLAPFTTDAEPIRIGAMTIAVVLTIVTGVDYLARAWRLRQSARRSSGDDQHE